MIEQLAEHHYIFPLCRWDLEQIDSEGLILDIGGGGEGVIGQLQGPVVIAIDYQIRELLEAPPDPQKLVLDARHLGFPDRSFQTVCAFFSLMYLPTNQDQACVLAEAARVLKRGGLFHLWDIDLGQLPKTPHPTYIVHLEYAVGGSVKETGYGSRWPSESRGLEYYRTLARERGFSEQNFHREGATFYLCLRKD